jgi:hypothetical protein
MFQINRWQEPPEPGKAARPIWSWAAASSDKGRSVTLAKSTVSSDHVLKQGVETRERLRQKQAQRGDLRGAERGCFRRKEGAGGRWRWQTVNRRGNTSAAFGPFSSQRPNLEFKAGENLRTDFSRGRGATEQSVSRIRPPSAGILEHRVHSPKVAGIAPPRKSYLLMRAKKVP